MNEEQTRWRNQFVSNIGIKEILKLGCAIMVWIFIGAGIAIAFALGGYSWSSIIFGIFLITMFFFPFVVHSSKPLYILTRKILGNENLPLEPYPSSKVKTPHQPLPWWGYLLAIWHYLLLLLILFIILKWYLK